MRSAMDENSIFMGWLRKASPKKRFTRDPREVHETMWLLGKSIPGRAEKHVEGPGGGSELGLSGEQQEERCGRKGVVKGGLVGRRGRNFQGQTVKGSQAMTKTWILL